MPYLRPEVSSPSSPPSTPEAVSRRTASEIILGLGIATGISELYVTSGDLFTFNHKTLLSVLAFLVIGLLLLLQYRSGLRGRRAARIVLVAYLLLTLAYPGVKFVTDILLT